jgi:PAS domain S-box-containing protein
MPLTDVHLAASALDALDSGLVVVDRDGVVVLWNSWMAAASRIDAAAAMGRPLGEVFAPAMPARLASAIEDAVTLGASSLLTHSLHPGWLPLRTRAGRPMTHNIALRPVGDKPYAHCVIQIADVTLATERERVLRARQNARYDAVVNSAPDAIMTFDAEGRVQLANPAAAMEFGYAANQLIGQPIDHILMDSEPWTAAWRALIADQDFHWPVELIVRRKDGASSYVDVSASKWMGEARAYVTAIFRNVNERRTAEANLRRLNETLEERVRERTADLERVHEQLRQSQKMEAVGQLTGGIAHDFNNLLTPILGGLDILQRRGVGDERGARLIDGALQSAERARTLVQRLLAFARRQPLKTGPVDVGRIVAGMTSLIGGTLGPGVRIVVDVAQDLPAAMADPNQLEMALLNLAVNARDAMPEGGVLTISARPAEVGDAKKLAKGRYILLAVSDTGIGMDAETLARATEPFFSTKGIGKGTGLGLSMIHGLAAQLGGGLELSSTPGIGTTVEVWLPLANGLIGRRTPHQVEEGVAAHAGVVLLVDDEDLIRATTAQMLADMGYTVIEASSATEAMRRLADPRLDLVVTDHLMPGMSGAALAREIQAKRPGLPVLLISGFAEVEDLAPDLPRLMKPFRAAELAAGLASLGRERPV